jgi:enoyl-CoA hydratase
MEIPKYKTILCERDKEEPHILYITLNRPEKNNAISIGSQEMTGELQDAIMKADTDDQVKVVIFRSVGENFSVGFDLEQVYRVYGGSQDVRPYQSTRLIIDESQIGFTRAIINCKKITMAEVHGWCIEAGMWIPECCDIAIAAKNAKFAHRGQRLAFGGMPFMPLELFLGHNKKIVELLITGRTISGAEAEQIGIITKAVEPEDLRSEVYNLARAICTLPLDAIVMGKYHRRSIYEATGMSMNVVGAVFHTLGTNIRYRPEERDMIFLEKREKSGTRTAFHMYHEKFEEILNKTKYFKSFGGK